LPISNSRTRFAGGADSRGRLCSRPGHSETRISLKSAEIGFASAKPASRETAALQRGIDEAVGDDFAIAAIAIA
jgi:hypothetical protein